MTLTAAYIVLLALLILYLWIRKKYPEVSLKHSVFEIRLGQENNAEEKTIELYNLLAELKIPFTVEVILHEIGEEIRFFITLNSKKAYKAKDAIFSIFPNAEVVYSPFQELLADLHSEIRAVSLVQAKGVNLPIKVEKTDHFSPFQSFLRVLSELKSFNESAGLQLVVSPAGFAKSKQISMAIDALSNSDFDSAKHILDKDAIVTKQSLKILEEKVSRPLFKVDAKIIFSSDNKERLDSIEEKIKSAFNQTATGGPAYNNIEARRIVAPKNVIESFYKKEINAKTPMLLNSAELSELFYFTGAKIEKMPKLSSVLENQRA
ncbi:MAG: hypothetical protein Q8Q32_01560 [bacterium]|nr:hypothetical protein [bacterium]